MWRTPRITGQHPGPRHGHSTAKVGAKLFVIGGSLEASNSADVVVLDTGTHLLYPFSVGDRIYNFLKI